MIGFLPSLWEPIFPEEDWLTYGSPLCLSRELSPIRGARKTEACGLAACQNETRGQACSGLQRKGWVLRSTSGELLLRQSGAPALSQDCTELLALNNPAQAKPEAENSLHSLVPVRQGNAQKGPSHHPRSLSNTGHTCTLSVGRPVWLCPAVAMASGSPGGDAMDRSQSMVDVTPGTKVTRLDARGLVTCSDSCTSKFQFGFLDAQFSDFTLHLICAGGRPLQR